MKVLFLDIDGVLNSAEYLAANPGAFDRGRPDAPLCAFDPAACARLERVLARTGAAIVVSSSWRIGHAVADIERWLRARGAPSARCVDRTPAAYACAGDPAGCYTLVLPAQERGHEIQAWLTKHAGAWDAFAIVDDSGDMAHLRHMLVQTTWERGLRDEHVDALCDLLGA